MSDMTALITFANAYEFENQGGEKMKGVTVEYLMTDTLIPINNDDGSKGVRHCKESLPLDKLSCIKEVPGWYNLSFALKPGSKGKPVMKLDNIVFVDKVFKDK